MARFTNPSRIVLLATLAFVFWPATASRASDDEVSADDVARQIEAKLEQTKVKQPWEGIFTKQRGFDGCTLYVAGDRFALIGKREDWGTGRPSNEPEKVTACRGANRWKVANEKVVRGRPSQSPRPQVMRRVG